MATPKTIGILTAGGDSPGLNAAIRGVGKTAILKYGMNVLGIEDGFTGLLERRLRPLHEPELSGILTLGGTILGTTREKPFKKKDIAAGSDKPQRIVETCRDFGLDALVCIGGNGTMKNAARIAELGVPVIGLPKTIDNDVWGTDFSFGFDSARAVATEAIDRLHTTANSHGRIMVIEVMGHKAGWLALEAGIAGGGDVVLLPELPVDLDVVAQSIRDRFSLGKKASIVVVAEGVTHPAGPGVSVSTWLARELEARTGIESRCTVLGYLQRGGPPSAANRILASRFGSRAADLIAAGKFGLMVAMQGNQVVTIPLSETAGKTKTVPVDHPLICEARSLGVCFGQTATSNPCC